MDMPKLGAGFSKNFSYQGRQDVSLTAESTC